MNTWFWVPTKQELVKLLQMWEDGVYATNGEFTLARLLVLQHRSLANAYVMAMLNSGIASWVETNASLKALLLTVDDLVRFSATAVKVGAGMRNHFLVTHTSQQGWRFVVEERELLKG